MIKPGIKVGIIGAGTMGSGIAQVASAAGHKVILFDSNEIALSKAEENLNKTLRMLLEKGKLNKDGADRIRQGIFFVNSPAEFEECGLVIEAIIENAELKKTLLTELERVVPDDCVIGTNTSSLSIASLASVCKKPGRVIGIHFFNPAPIMQLVEIIPGISTDTDVTTRTRELINNWGKLTVLVKDTPGFIVNRLARPYYGEAIRIYEEGIADIATIDWAMKEFGGFRMGPFELMDFIGNDVNFKVTETVWEQFFYDPRYKPSLTQKRLFEAGLFGKKTGKGYYDYSSSTQMPQPDKDSEKGRMIFMRIFSMLVNEAAEALMLKVASAADLDLAMEKGVNYPKGLLKWADEAGIESVLLTLSNLQEEYGEDRYRPSALLKRMVRENRTFY